MNATVSDRFFRFAIIGAALLFAALILPSLFVQHIENDEVIYRVLADKLTNAPLAFNIRDTPLIAQLPPAQYDHPLFRHPPVFFYLLAALYKFAGPAFGPLLPLASGAAIIVLAACIARRLFSAETAVITAALLCCCPFLIFTAGKLWIETTYTALMTGALLVFIAGYDRRSFALIACAGLIEGLALAAKYPAAGIIPAVACYALMKKTGLRQAAACIWLFLACAAIVFTPWLAWHRAVMGSAPLDIHFRMTGDYLARFPFVEANMRHPVWHYLQWLPVLAPLYLASGYTIYRKWRDPQVAALGLWAACMLAGFSLLGLQIGYAFRYLLPAAVALAILSADALQSVRRPYLIIGTALLLAFQLATGLVNAYALIAADLRPLPFYFQALVSASR